jgi:hypothetical protein
MKRETLGMKIARYFQIGMLLITLLMLAAPVAVYAGNGQEFNTNSMTELGILGMLAIGFVTTKDFKINGKTVKLGQLGIDKGFYKEADGKKGAIVALEEMYAKESGEDSPYLGLSHPEIYLKKKELRSLGLEVPLTAYEKQLILANISIKGALADSVEKFFSSSQNAVLFPAFVSDQILVGQLMDAPINDFIHTRTTINSKSYDKVTMDETEEERQTKQKEDGANLREFTISVGNRSVKVKTFGGLIKTSYESVRYAKIPILAKFLQRVGAQIAIDKMDELVLVMKNGDGNTGTAITSGRTLTQAASGAIAVIDVIKWATFANMPYKVDRFVGLKAHLQEYYAALAGMNNPKDQFDFVGITLPKAYEWPRSTSGLDASTNAFYGIDSRYAIEEVNNGPVLVESDKLIDRQIERSAVTESSGFAVDENAIYRFTAQ